MENDHRNITIGFVGQGWIGKNYADHFEDAGYRVIRYALEEPYVNNKSAIAQCDIVFLAVPTPMTPDGFDGTRVKDALSVVGKGKVAVIKSTIPPGTTRELSKIFPDITIVHVPEFLREAYARHDVDHPERLIIGILEDSPRLQQLAKTLIAIHPKAKFTKIVRVEEAELVKYAHNTLGYATVVFMNMLYDLSLVYGVEWEFVKEAILNNSWYPSKYLDPVHKGGRGAGGDCFIKDFAALRDLFERNFQDDARGIALLKAFEEKNNELLRKSGKDLDLLRGVYGD